MPEQKTDSSSSQAPTRLFQLPYPARLALLVPICGAFALICGLLLGGCRRVLDPSANIVLTVLFVGAIVYWLFSCIIIELSPDQKDDDDELPTDRRHREQAETAYHAFRIISAWLAAMFIALQMPNKPLSTVILVVFPATLALLFFGENANRHLAKRTPTYTSNQVAALALEAAVASVATYFAIRSGFAETVFSWSYLL